MDKFKEMNQIDVDSIDYNVPQYTQRRKGDGQMLRQLARHRLKQELRKELNYNGQIN